MRNSIGQRTVAIILIGAFVLASCETVIPPEALQLTKESLKQRQAQTRRFETRDEAKLLSASAAVLQDLGFNLDESETKLGLIVASKDRDAVEAGQVVFAIFYAALTGVAMPIDKNQKIRVSLVTRKVGEGKYTTVRVTFQRMVWNTQGQLTKAETLDEPKMYQEFFSKLSKSIFLDAHAI